MGGGEFWYAGTVLAGQKLDLPAEIPREGAAGGRLSIWPVMDAALAARADSKRGRRNKERASAFVRHDRHPL